MFQLQCLKALEIQIEEGKGIQRSRDRKKDAGKQINNLPMLQKIPRRRDSWKIKDLPEKERNS